MKAKKIEFKMTAKWLTCVNSNWVAYGFHKEGQEHCECGFQCKIRVSIETNGHAPYDYIVTVKEYKRLLKDNRLPLQ